MDDYFDVLGTGDLKEGMMKKVSAGGREVLVALAGGKYYCADSRCPHLGGDLSRGSLSGTILTCPLHGSQFDITDGRAVRWTDWSGIKLSLTKALKAPRPLRTHDVKVENGRVLVRLK